jgi:DNA-directed RNA polymerase specialized sigma24 family protein
MTLDDSDLEEAYNLAWAGVYEMIKSGKEVNKLTALLVQITWRRAVDSYRSSRPSQHEDIEIADRGVEHDYAEDLDDREKLRHLIRSLKGRLNQREREAVSLCLIRGYTRPEAAELLKLPEPVLQKVMDGAMKKIGGIVTSLSARGCGDDEWARLMRAHAFGLLEETHRDYPRARDHVDVCDACRRYVLGLRGIASICPPTLPMLGGHIAAGLALIRGFLRDLFAGTHSGATVAALQSGASSAGGGLSAGTLGGMTAAKGVAALAVAAALTATTNYVAAPKHHFHAGTGHAETGHSRETVPPDASAAIAVPAAPPVVRAFSGAHRAGSSSSSAQGHTAFPRNPRARVSREFGFETSPATRTAPLPKPTAAHAASVRHEDGKRAAAREFGPEM